MKLLFDNLDLFLRLAPLEFFLQLLGVAEVVCGFLLLTGFAERLAVFTATAGMLIWMALVARADPSMLPNPYGAVIKDLCLIACAFTLWTFSSARSRRSVVPA